MALPVVIDHKWYIVLELSLDSKSDEEYKPFLKLPAWQAATLAANLISIRGVYVRALCIDISIYMSNSVIFTVESDKIRFSFRI